MKRESPALAVKKFVAARATVATSPTSETAGGRAAASEPTANSAANGTTTWG